MAADRQRLAAALAYEEERRRRMMESVPGLVTTPAQPAPREDFRTNLENLSIGLGEGLTNQLEGVKSIVTDPVGTAKGVYEAGRAVIRDPSVIADALRYTAQKATSGPLGAGEVIGEMIGPRKGGPMMQELDVYHGTPHRFPATEANPLGEFDASKIGTGEGAQAYGHGIYYAESPDVAESYRVGTTFAQKADRDIAEMLYSQKSGDADAAIASLKSEIKQLEKQGMPEGYKEQYDFALQKLQEFKKNPPKGGSLYKADLPDEMIDRMLDYDKPMSQQPEAVKKILMQDKRLKSLYERGKIDDFYDNAGHFYRTIMAEQRQTAPINLSEEAAEKWAEPLASERLRQMGIPGIKYLDAGSRGQGGSGTRNFVVFPGEEKKVRILERDGQKAPPQKIAQALEAAPRKPETAFNAPEVKPGDIVDGLKVRPEVANVGSIKASLDNYTVLPGIRSVSIADFGEAGPLTGNVDKLDRRTRNLADQITESKEITPLIVVYSGTQNYILEGSHRIDALDALGKKRIPVIAVIDEDDPPKFMRQKR